MNLHPTFKTCYATPLALLMEKLTTTNLTDLYIIMSMPTIADPAHRFVQSEIIKESRAAIIDEIQRILINEVSHASSRAFDKLLSLGYNHVFALYARELGGPRTSFAQMAYEDKLKPAATPGNNKKKTNWLQILPLPAVVDVFEDLYDLKQGAGWSKYLKSFQIFSRFLETIESRHDSGHANYNFEEASKLAKTSINYDSVFSLFNQDIWDDNDSYGGKAWQKITLAAKKLDSTTDNISFLKQFDRFIDLVHNTAEVIDKFEGYREGWIQYILDLKQHAINIRALIPYASKEVQKMFGSQEWRMMMTKIPGEGAERETQPTQQLLTKYLKQARNDGVGFGEPWLGPIIQIFTQHRGPKFDQMLKAQDQFNIMYLITGISEIDWTETGESSAYLHPVKLRNVTKEMYGYLLKYLARNTPDKKRAIIKMLQFSDEVVADGAAGTFSDDKLGPAFNNMFIRELKKYHPAYKDLIDEWQEPDPRK